MACPNLPPGFDFTDPDLYVKGLPVEELAELRKVRADLVERAADRQGRLRRRRLLGGDQAQRTSRRCRCAATSSPAARTRDPPAFGRTTRARTSTSRRFVMLNMDAPHHTRLRKIISRGFTPRAIDRLRDELNERAQNIAKAAAAEGFRRLRRAGVVRAAAAGDRRSAGRAPGGPQEAVRLVQPDDRRRGPEFAHIDPMARLGRTDHVRHEDGRAEGQEPRRRHRHQADPGRRRRRQALRRRVRLLRDPAGGGRQRDHPQLDHPRHDGVHRHSRTSGSCTRRSARRPPPTRSSAGPPRSRRSSAPRSRTPSCPACRSRRASGW